MSDLRDIHLSTGDIAKYTNVSLRTVIRWIERGELKGYKLPGRGNNRVLASDFVNFLKQNAIPVPAEFRGGGRSIVVVDDDKRMCKVYADLLYPYDVSVYLESDSFRAGVTIGVECPDLVILDLNMPGLNGFQVLDNIRSNERLEKVKVLVVSSMSEGALSRAKESGANGALAKPFSTEELILSISQLIGNLDRIK